MARFSSAAAVMALALGAMVWFLARRSAPPSGPATPRTISAAESEALITERVGTAPAAGRPAPVPDAPQPSSVRDAVVFTARLMDERAASLSAARLAWVELDAEHGPEERAAAAVESAGAVWLTLERGLLPEDGSPAILSAAAPGRAQRFLSVPPERWRAGLCNLGEIALPPGGDVEGRVLDEHGAPVARARLALTEARKFDASERARRRVWDRAEPIAIQGTYPVAWTDADGRYRIEGAPLGRFALVAETGPLRPHGARLPARSEPLEVRAGWTTVVPDLVLARPLATELCAGVVLDASGSAVARALVRLIAAGVDVDFARTDPDGRFELLALAGEPLLLRAEAPEGEWSAALDGVQAGTTDLVLRP